MSYEYELSFSRRFEAAHRLSMESDPVCSNIHGHSWNIRWHYCFKDSEHNILDSPKGFFFNFSELKKKFSAYLSKHYDHAVLLNKKDAIARDIKHSKVVLYSKDPTTEIVCLFFNLFLWHTAPKGFNGEIITTLAETVVNTVRIKSCADFYKIHKKDYVIFNKQFR